MINIVLLGLPGSGKSTHGKRIAEKHNLFYLEAGNIIREEIDKNTDLGSQLKKYVETGDLVPDELIKKVLEPVLEEQISMRGIVFDGFPRTTEQAEYLSEFLESKGTKIHFVILLKIDDSTAKERILETRQKEEARPDDTNEELVDKRIGKQKKRINQLTDFYENQLNNRPYALNSDSSIELVQDAIEGIIDEKVHEN